MVMGHRSFMSMPTWHAHLDMEGIWLHEYMDMGFWVSPRYYFVCIGATEWDEHKVAMILIHMHKCNKMRLHRLKRH